MNVMTLVAKLSLDNKDYKDKLKDSEEKTKGFSAGMIAKGQLIADAVKVGLKAVKNLAQMSIQGYAQYEQLVGGVETLFGTGGDSLEEYAKRTKRSVDDARDDYNRLMETQNKVLENSKKAFKTAGMSQNTYLDTAVSFSASLIQSLEGDTQKAADLTDLAMQDMSDNANKMGTSMESVMYAYKGFSRGQFMMLDNLKLGYAGTKSEMERLIADANKVKEANGEMADLSIENFSDMIEAIHIIQTEMNITGTTVKEAETTIEGSMKMARASFQDLMVGIADDEADFDQLVDNFVNSVIIAGKNLLPRIEVAVEGVGKLLETFAVEILPLMIDYLVQNIPKIIETGAKILMSLVTGLLSAIPTLIEAIPDIIMAIVNTIIDNKQNIIDAGKDIVTYILDGIKNAWHKITTWVLDKITDLFNIEERARERNDKDKKGSRTGKKKDGSGANGIPYVPYDGYIAELHRGERVLTKQEVEGKDNQNKAVNVVQNIYSKAMTASDLMQEALYKQERAVFVGV